MKKRILFVDDEPMVLQGLQRMLRPMREEWDMVFVEGGEKALATMAVQPFDVVVTDMRMPVMNGAQLLAAVRDRYPKTVRLVLSGHADGDLISQCLGVAHQYISKPCEPEQLRSMIRNASLIGGDRVTDKVKGILGTIDQLPSMPAVFRQLEQALADPDSSTQRLGDIIQQDMGMTAKILKIVNSAFFGLRRTIASPHEAVAYLGVETIKALVLVNSIFERAEPLKTRHLNMEDLWRHSLACANGARAITLAEGGSRQDAEQVFVGGILEDVGILVLAANFPEAYDRASEILLAEHVLLTTVEQEEFAVTHAEVGAYLLGLWGLPAHILRTVSLHHSPHLMLEPGFSPEVAVYAADILVGEQGGAALFRTGRFDMITLGRLGLADRLEVWRHVVHTQPGNPDGAAHG
jgi:HD-like signal output (HDOD) protein/ActR/RegA family two-component response regulator